MSWLTIVATIAWLSTVTILLRVCLRFAATSSASTAVQAVGQRIDRRALWRSKVYCRGTLAGVRGTPHDLPARCANVSEYGALILVGQPLETGLEVVLTIPLLRLIGIGRVRHCQRRILRYAVGIEFNGPLRRADAGEWTIRKQK